MINDVLSVRPLPAPRLEAAHERGWPTLRNGELLREAQATGFEAFVTTDRNLRYRRNLAGRTIAILALPTTSWPRPRDIAARIQTALGACRPGAYIEVAA